MKTAAGLDDAPTTFSLQLWAKAPGRIGVHQARGCPRPAKRALKCWRKMALGQTRLLMNELTKSAVSAVLLAAGQRSQAVFNELSSPRTPGSGPGKLLAAIGFQHAVVVLLPLERGEDKARIYDSDSRQHESSLARKGLETPCGTAKGERRRSWRRAVRILDVEDCAQSPYQNRHGGASRDHLLRFRSVNDKPGRLQRQGEQAH